MKPARLPALFVGNLLLVACSTTPVEPDAAPTATIVCFGDSTTAPRSLAGRSIPVYPQLLRQNLAYHGLPGPIVNSGVGGSHSGRRTDNDRHKVRHGRDRFERAVLRQDPDLVIIQFGLNDSWVDGDNPDAGPRIPLDAYHRNLTHFVTSLRARGVAVILMTPNAIGKKYETWRKRRLGLYAAAVREVAETHGIRLVRVHEIFRRAKEGPDSLLLDGMHPNARGHQIIANELLAAIGRARTDGDFIARDRRRPTHYTIPTLDLAGDRHRQVVVDRQDGQYLGHPTTVLLEDHKTMITVYPKGHGKGGIVMKRSTDAGLSWGGRLPVPANWSTSKEVPTLHRVIDANGKKRIIMWSGLYPARLAVSEDDGMTWTPLRKVGDWGGIVVMGCVAALRTPGQYMAMFHDDGRFFTKDGMKTYRQDRKAGKPRTFTLYKTFSQDGGLTWTFPEPVWNGTDVHLCEPGVVRSPDGRRLAVLLRENSRTRNSHIIFSDDEGMSFTEPREMPASLTGDRHTGQYSPDGRLFLSFRDRTLVSPTFGDWVGWVGTFDDLVHGRPGQYRVRLMDNHRGADCAYPGVEVLPDGTLISTTYGHWQVGKSPYIVSVRFRLSELDALHAARLHTDR
jgi:lysophospholipase L1-like esterase